MRTTNLSILLAAASANNIAQSQTPTSGTALTLNGTTAGVLDVARRVLLTYGNEGSARTMLITGTDRYGNAQSETLAVPSGAGGTVATLLDYKTVTQALPAGGGWTAAVTLGTNGVASTPWVKLDSMLGPQDVGLQLQLNGITANVTFQTTLGNPNFAQVRDTPVPLGSSALTQAIPSTSDVTGMTGISADTSGKIANPAAWVRAVVNSGATAGEINCLFQQSGLNT